MKTIFVLLTVAFLSSRVVAEEPTQYYRITQFPNVSGGCEQAARRIGDVVKNAGKVRVEALHYQTVEKGAACNITVTYFAPEALTFETTFKTTGHGPFSDSRLGLYQSFAQCQAALPDQRRWFEQETRLPVSIAYCFKLQFVDTIDTTLPYEARIEGFGKTLRRPFHFATAESTTPSGYAHLKRLRKEILEKMAKEGVAVARVAIDRELAGTVAFLKVLYYSEKPFEFPGVLPHRR